MSYPNVNRRKMNLFKSIFRDNLADFKKAYPEFDTPYYDEVISKMLNCGTTAGGYAEMFQKIVNRNPFVCRKCGKGMELSHLSHPDRGGTFFDAFVVNQ